MASTSRRYRSYGNNAGSGGFSDTARANAARARAEKKTSQLEELFLSFLTEEGTPLLENGNPMEEFRVAGLDITGLRWSILSIDTTAKTVSVETTDRCSPMRQYHNLPYRAVTHAPLEWVEDDGTEWDSAGTGIRVDVLNLLRQEENAGDVWRLQKLRETGARGLRWTVTAFNEEEGMVSLTSNKRDLFPDRIAYAAQLDYAPLTEDPAARGGGRVYDRDNQHLARHAYEGSPWGERDEEV